MIKSKKSFTKKQTISLLEVKNSESMKYKVTRSIPELSISETKVFKSKKEAIKQFNDWLEYQNNN